MKHYCVVYHGGDAGHFIIHLINQHRNFTQQESRIAGDNKWIYVTGATWNIIETPITKKLNDRENNAGITDQPILTEEEFIKYQRKRATNPNFTKVAWRVPEHSTYIIITNYEKIRNAKIRNDNLDLTFIFVEISDYRLIANRFYDLIKMGKFGKVSDGNNYNNKAEVIKFIETKHEASSDEINAVKKMAELDNIPCFVIDSTNIIKGDMAEYLKLCKIIDEEPDTKLFKRIQEDYVAKIWSSYL